MSNSMKQSWTDLKAEAAKLKAEAEVRGGALKDSLKRTAEQLEQKANDARDRLANASDAGKENARESMSHVKQAYAEAKASLEKAWQELRN